MMVGCLAVSLLCLVAIFGSVIILWEIQNYFERTKDRYRFEKLVDELEDFTDL